MQKDIALVFDCGATNVRVVAMDTEGQIVASKAFSNETDDDPYLKDGRIWDEEKLWKKFSMASLEVCSRIEVERIAGVSMTTFGVDGTLVAADGTRLYPVISWQCPRTSAILKSVERYMPLSELYAISGVYPYAFNTLFKLIWFRENRPDLLEKAHRFLFIPSLFIHRLTGEMINDATMLGTSMVEDALKRGLSSEILERVGISPSLFGEVKDPGTMAGRISVRAANETGIPAGTPVFLAGHDTQFAIIGSGAGLNEPVLSSGTWEILMARSLSFKATEAELLAEITTELDVVPGIYNIGQNWMGSGTLEWVGRSLFSELSGNALYERMIEEAGCEAPGAGGVWVNPAFYKDAGKEGGSIFGLTLQTRRGQVYRAALEALACRLRMALEALEQAGSFKAANLIAVGGGTKNALWNQIRADVCGCPIRLVRQKETTVLGAAMTLFVAAGYFPSLDDARKLIAEHSEWIYPSKHKDFYAEYYSNYRHRFDGH